MTGDRKCLTPKVAAWRAEYEASIPKSDLWNYLWDSAVWDAAPGRQQGLIGNALKEHGINTLVRFRDLTLEDMQGIPNIGKKGWKVLLAVQAEMNCNGHA